jgi:hypothetical protein
MYLQLNHYEYAVLALERQRDVLLDVQDFPRLGRIYGEIASCQQKLGNPEQALVCL